MCLCFQERWCVFNASAPSHAIASATSEATAGHGGGLAKVCRHGWSHGWRHDRPQNGATRTPLETHFESKMHKAVICVHLATGQTPTIARNVQRQRFWNVAKVMLQFTSLCDPLCDRLCDLKCDPKWVYMMSNCVKKAMHATVTLLVGIICLKIENRVF